MFENYKIRVNDEAESKEAQELFFELGFIFGTGLGGVKHLDCKFLYARNGIIKIGYDSDNFECSANKETTLDQLRNLVAEKKNESGLISGADALRALADGKEVEYFCDKNGWIAQDSKQLVVAWYLDDVYKFRLKPSTIILNGIEIPAPFEPKKGDLFWHISPEYMIGYGESMYNDGNVDTWQQFGAWRTEEQIKQVVAALRGALK